jgi:hypothetical protein
MPSLDPAATQRRYRERQAAKLDKDFNELQAVCTAAALLCEHMKMPHHTHQEVIESLSKMRHSRPPKNASQQHPQFS